MNLMTLLRKPIGWAWRATSRVLKQRDDLVVIATFPDFDDSARAVRDALAGSNYTIVFLQGQDSVVPSWFDTGNERVLSKKSLSGMLAFHRAKWVVVTHGLYTALPKTGRQFVINLWHGMPIKKIGAMLSDDDIPHCDVVLAECPEYRNIMCETLMVAPTQVLQAPHPRIDMMFKVDQELRRRCFGDKSVLVWLPTYREGRIGKIRSDGMSELSILRTISQFRKLDEYLQDLNAVCILKPHPMEAISENRLESLESIKVWTDEDLENNGLSLYQLLGLADALITDVSSVYFEYKRLGRPIFCFFPDYDAYEAGRGFVRPFQELVDLPILRTETQLLDEIVRSFHGRKPGNSAGVNGTASRPEHARFVLRECGMDIP